MDQVENTCAELCSLILLGTKGELDAVEHKQQYDAQLLKATTDAAEFKAMYDKVRGCIERLSIEICSRVLPVPHSL